MTGVARFDAVFDAYGGAAEKPQRSIEHDRGDALS